MLQPQYKTISELYKRGGAGKDYKDSFYSWFLPLREEFGLGGNYTRAMKEKL